VPSDYLNLPFWNLGNGFLLLDDLSVDYAALQAETDAAAALAAAAQAAQAQRSSPSDGGVEPMLSLISGPGGTPVYLTNLVATLTNGSMTVAFGIAGGTNGFAYDMYGSTNPASSPVYSQWTWLGQGYTSNRYTFTNQPAGCAFYVLAIPRQTMVVTWGDAWYGARDVPPGLTNAIDVAGGSDFSLALKADGTVVAWGENTNGKAVNVPAGLTNVTSLAAGGDFSMALLQNGTVVAWGTNDQGQLNVPAGLTNVTGIAAGPRPRLAKRWNRRGVGSE
jgi:hypothetical protein